MAANGTQLQDEDSLSFLSSAFGALGQTINQSSNPNVFLLGLILAGVSKALPSLTSDKNDGDKIEDIALFAFSVITFVLAGWQTNGTFTNPPATVYVPILLGMLVKTGMGFRKIKKKSRRNEQKVAPEDFWGFVLALVSLVLALAVIVGVIGPGSQAAVSVTLFLSFLLKTLLPSKPNA